MSFAALLIEICYTRVISYKLFYYYTYLVIGLALLGIGTGGVLVAVSRALRRPRTDTVLVWSFLFGGCRRGRELRRRWRTCHSTRWPSGTTARRRRAKSMGELVAICLLVFVPFVAPGVIISTLFGRRPEGVGSLYFADLVGAGLACAIVIYLTATIGPPAAIMLAGGVMFLGGRHRAGGAPDRWRYPSPWLLVAGMVVLVAGAQPAARPAPRHQQGRAS